MAPERSSITVRPRVDADLERLVALLALTQAESGYPVDAGHVRADWIAAEGELAAWVAETDGLVNGHVALHPAHGVSLSLWTAATGRDARDLAVVSRLFSRAPGVGTALLAAAVTHVAELGRAAVLETTRDSPAHAFYLRRGWTEAGEVTQSWGGSPVRVAVLVFG